MGQSKSTPRPIQPAAERLRPSLPRRYKLIREIGRGPSGVVYLARDREYSCPVAVKVFRSGDVAWDQSHTWSLGSAIRTRHLDHGHITRVLDAGEADGESWVIREYVHGRSLRAWIAKGPMTPLRAACVLRQAANGVGYAHENGVIHGGLKPSNILLDKKDWVYVSDFLTSVDSDRVGEGLHPPPCTVQDDILALGGLLYEMLTGRPREEGSTAGEVRARIVEAQPLGASGNEPHSREGLAAICLKAMALDPRARYASALELCIDLESWNESRPLLARRPWWVRRFGRWIDRRTPVLLPLFALIATLSAVAWSECDDWVVRRKISAAERLDREAVRAGLDAFDQHFAEGHWLEALNAGGRIFAKATSEERETLYYDLATAAMVMGDCDEAIEPWERILPLAPEDWKDLYASHAAQAMVRDLMRGHRSIEEAVREEPAKANRAASRIRIALRKGYTSTETQRRHEVILGIIESGHPQ